MKASKETKNTRLILWILRIVDAIILVCPVVVYIIMALADGNLVTTKKVALICTVIIALILVLFNIIGQKHLRSPLWIILIGLYVCIENLIPLMIMLAVGSVLDELVLAPFIRKYKMRLEANVVLDKRLNDGRQSNSTGQDSSTK